MIRLGIVGLGMIGTSHTLGFDHLHPECEITALCDPREEKFRFLAGYVRHGRPAYYADFRDLLDRAPVDALVICTPNHLHAPVAKAALAAGKDLFLEKPIAHTLEAADEVILAWSRTDRIVQVGLVYRYANLYRHLARMVEEGVFGDVLFARCNEHRDNFPTDWFFHQAQVGGALLDKDCHHFDLFTWLLRARPTRVFASGGAHVVKGERYRVACGYAPDPDLIVSQPDIVDHAFVIVDYENGASANLSLCMYQKEPLQGLEVNICGTNGAWAVASRDKSLRVGGGPLGKPREIPVDCFGDNEGFGHIGCQAERKAFLACVRERRQPYANLQTGRWSMLPALAAEASIKEGRLIEIKSYHSEAVEKVFAARLPSLFSPTPR